MNNEIQSTLWKYLCTTYNEIFITVNICYKKKKCRYFPKSPLRDLSILIFFRIAFRYYAMWPWHQIERVWRLQPVDNLFSSCDSQSAQAKRCLEGSFFTIPSLSARTWQSDGIKKYKVKALVSSSKLLSQESWRDQNKLRLIDIGE